MRVVCTKATFPPEPFHHKVITSVSLSICASAGQRGVCTGAMQEQSIESLSDSSQLLPLPASFSHCSCSRCFFYSHVAGVHAQGWAGEREASQRWALSTLSAMAPSGGS
eukprot:1151187-Pelagomonas_calceolata.AAC.6